MFPTALCLGGSVEPISRLLRGRGKKISFVALLESIVRKLFVEKYLSYITVIQTPFFFCLGGIVKLITMDTSYDMVKRCKDAEVDGRNEGIETSFLVGDEEFLPVKER